MSDTENTSPEVVVTEQPNDSSEEKVLTLGDLIKDETLKASGQLDKFLNQPIDALAKSHIHANSLIGKRVVDMSPEDIIAFNKKLGAPQRSDDYTFQNENDLPQDEVRALKDKFFKFGLNQVAAEHLFNDALANNKKAVEKVIVDTESKRDENINKLIEKFGSTYKGTLDLIEQELLEQGGIELRNRVLDPVTMDHQLIDVFAKTVKEKRAHGLLQPNPTAPIVYTAGDIDNEIAMIKASPEFRDARLRRDTKAMKAFDDQIIKLLRIKQVRK